MRFVHLTSGKETNIKEVKSKKKKEKRLIACCYHHDHMLKSLFSNFNVAYLELFEFGPSDSVKIMISYSSSLIFPSFQIFFGKALIGSSDEGVILSSLAQVIKTMTNGKLVNKVS